MLFTTILGRRERSDTESLLKFFFSAEVVVACSCRRGRQGRLRPMANHRPLSGPSQLGAAHPTSAAPLLSSPTSAPPYDGPPIVGKSVTGMGVVKSDY